MEHQSEMRRIQIYDETFKRKVIDEYLAGGISKMDLLRKYNIRTKSGIQRWMKKFGYTDVYKSTEVKFTSITSADLPKKTDLKNDSDLLKKIRELERQLAEEKLRSEAYARIIDKAEKELKIPIRKKPNTKSVRGRDPGSLPDKALFFSRLGACVRTSRSLLFAEF